MGLERPRSLRESLYARLVTLALINDGVIDANDDETEDSDHGA